MAADKQFLPLCKRPPHACSKPHCAQEIDPKWDSLHDRGKTEAWTQGPGLKGLDTHTESAAFSEVYRLLIWSGQWHFETCTSLTSPICCPSLRFMFVTQVGHTNHSERLWGLLLHALRPGIKSALHHLTHCGNAGEANQTLRFRFLTYVMGGRWQRHVHSHREE